ncbi:hypothetical protein KFK09_015633 [Dendrobium nobile]|uniref:Uncharacterized protein n=1 Tax=Dendrobium nobile TaxID=94219 RepID=A0A8T3B6J4_DENNO|nr:hypothetical protein KFK09_015633 [Dendrobium nobile]
MLLELVIGHRALCFEGRDDMLLLDHIRTLSFAISDCSRPDNEENLLEYYQGCLEMIRKDLLTEHLKLYLERALTLNPCYYGDVNGDEVTAI